MFDGPDCMSDNILMYFKNPNTLNYTMQYPQHSNKMFPILHIVSKVKIPKLCFVTQH